MQTGQKQQPIARRSCVKNILRRFTGMNEALGCLQGSQRCQQQGGENESSDCW